MRHWLHHLSALLACAFFFLAGQAFVPLLGIEGDEALFAAPLLQPRTSFYTLRVAHSRVPLMLMSYIGTLKTLLYSLVFRMFAPGVWSAREPMLIAGAASIWIFYLLLRRTAGTRTALMGAALLATHPLYLLTTCFDWGPVALQHLLLLGGSLLLVRFAQEPKAPGAHRQLAGGFFLFGLAMWDKALAVWMLSGMGLAAAVVLRRPLAALATRRRIGIAALAFLLGALPLAVFNLKTHGSTFRGNVKRDTGRISSKALMLLNTVNGQGLFGYLTDEDWQTPRPHPPAGALAQAADVAEAAGHPRHNLMLWALGLALALAPLAGRAERRAIAFCLITLAVAWVQMALTANTGASVHHTILLWPLPEWICAVSFAAASRRDGRAGIPALAAVVMVLAASNVLVTGEYYVMMARDGGSVSWDDAIFPLSRQLGAIRPGQIFCVDWGIEDSLRLIGRGRLPLSDLTGGADDTGVFSTPGRLFVGRTREMEVFQGNADKLARMAETAGYRRQTVAAISDSFGRPVFEVWEFGGRGPGGRF